MDSSPVSPSPLEQLPVCIIGAGSSGVTLAKALKEQGVAFECYEIGTNVGGMWRYENDNGLSSAYRSLHIDTSRFNLGYSDFPISDRYPDFLSHFEVLEYLEAYADRFGVKPHIRFKTRVEQVKPAALGGWDVTLASGETRRFRAVIVANGHLWDPRWATLPGQFEGEQIHSHYYRTAEPFKGKNVMIIGMGNSGVDVAVDVCKGAASTTISTRRSAWILPKYIMGHPTDRWSAFFAKRIGLPTRVTRTLVLGLAKLMTGDQGRFGIPRPAHPVWREHATLSQELLPFCGHGWIRVKPDLKHIEGKKVTFADGSSKDIDVIIHATGYKTSFPFLDKQIFEVRDGHVELYRRMLVAGQPGLYMLGLVQPVGPTIPLVEIQARWLASVLSGETALPEQAVMSREIRDHNNHVAKRFVGSARYTLEVDFKTYARQLFHDMAQRRAGA